MKFPLSPFHSSSLPPPPPTAWGQRGPRLGKSADFRTFTTFDCLFKNSMLMAPSILCVHVRCINFVFGLNMQRGHTMGDPEILVPLVKWESLATLSLTSSSWDETFLTFSHPWTMVVEEIRQFGIQQVWTPPFLFTKPTSLQASAPQFFPLLPIPKLELLVLVKVLKSSEAFCPNYLKASKECFHLSPLSPNSWMRPGFSSSLKLKLFK